jgi:hypothetical protein
MENNLFTGLTMQINSSINAIDTIHDISNGKIPTIVFESGPMAGIMWSDATPGIYGGNGRPIKEHREIYEYCYKNNLKFHWTIK